MKQKGIITYSCVFPLPPIPTTLTVHSPAQSPFRQNPTKHMFRGYLFNGVRRLAGQMPYWIVPVALGEHHISFFLFRVAVWSSQYPDLFLTIYLHRLRHL